ncbi:MAG: DNA repair protein RadC [Muribaculaceae bacterium]|nr:DNA repair protein RadC [Muribaculaceae bacterium]
MEKYIPLIKDLAADDRPRERAMKHGVKSLSDAELLAILFGTGLKGKSVIELSKEILDDNEGHLSRLSRITIQDFMKRYKGIGAAKAISVLSALELGNRAAADAVLSENDKISDSTRAAAIMRTQLGGLPHEEFWIMMLNRANHIIKKICVARGGISATVVDVKIILKAAIENYTSSMILFHNHPSGNLTPSPQDDNLTRKICKGASAVDIRVLDHIIITDASHYSYQDNGRMPVIEAY